MVRVWYEPPPFGPATSLDRTPYGVHGHEIFTKFWEKQSKLPRTRALAPWIIVGCALCYVPIYIEDQKEKPFTQSPEYVAASRAYMRYHNMDPDE